MCEMISSLAFFVAGVFIGLVMGRMVHGCWLWEAEDDEDREYNGSPYKGD